MPFTYVFSSPSALLPPSPPPPLSTFSLCSGNATADQLECVLTSSRRYGS